jgi:hypothetical protein
VLLVRRSKKRCAQNKSEYSSSRLLAHGGTFGLFWT